MTVPPNPPTTNTLPLDNSVAVWARCGMFIENVVAVHVPLAGSYNSDVAKYVELSAPPATSTNPFGNKVAVWL